MASATCITPTSTGFRSGTLQLSRLAPSSPWVCSLDVDELGNIYFAAGNTINKWTAATQQVTTLVSSGLDRPHSVAVDASGNVYIGDTFHSAVKKRDR